MNLGTYSCEFKPVCRLGQVEVFSNEYEDGKALYNEESYPYRSDKHPTRYYVQETLRKVALFFYNNFKICGLDNNGKIAKITIVTDLKNAHWAGMCADTSCGWHFDPDYFSPKVITHEYTHAVISVYSKLDSAELADCSRNEAGALNESISDVMACAYMHSIGKNNWKVIDRDLSQSVNMDDFKEGGMCNDDDDYGEVHDNSLIPSHAFYHVVQEVGEKNLLKIAGIWFKALLLIDNPEETFEDFACKTLSVTTSPKLCEVIKKSWENVGIYI
jgi:Zn-dependent metalloprotease